MSKFEKLAALNNIANDCVKDSDFVLASRFHEQFMKIAQMNEEPEASQPEDNSTVDAIVFAQTLAKCPNFISILKEAPTKARGAGIPTYQPIANYNTVKLVQELLGLESDGALGPLTINKMTSSLKKGNLDRELFQGFKKKFNI